MAQPMPKLLEAALESVSEAILLVGPDGTIVWLNAACADFFGPSAAQWMGRNAKDWAHAQIAGESQRETLVGVINGIIQGKAERHTETLEPVGPNGLSCQFEISRLGPSEARESLVLIRVGDVSAPSALKEATDRMRDFQDLVIRVLGHDLKTPLQVLKGYLDLARVDLDAPPGADRNKRLRLYFDKMDEGLASMGLLLANARAMSRLAMKPGERVPLEPIDLTRLLRQVIALERPLAAAAGVTLEEKIAEGVRADALKGFDSAFSNLISNGIKYSPKGSKVTIELSRGPDGGALFHVADQGPGIKEEDRRKMFVKFERLGRDDTVSGHGLGLSIVGTMVALCGGTVEIASRPDGARGTVFTVKLPPPKPAA